MRRLLTPLPLLSVGLTFFQDSGHEGGRGGKKCSRHGQLVTRLPAVYAFLYLLNFEPCKCIIYSKNE